MKASPTGRCPSATLLCLLPRTHPHDCPLTPPLSPQGSEQLPSWALFQALGSCRAHAAQDLPPGRAPRSERRRAGRGGPQRKPSCPAGTQISTLSNKLPKCSLRQKRGPTFGEAGILLVERTSSLLGFQGKMGPGQGGDNKGTPVTILHGLGMGGAGGLQVATVALEPGRRDLNSSSSI